MVQRETLSSVLWLAPPQRCLRFSDCVDTQGCAGGRCLVHARPCAPALPAPHDQGLQALRRGGQGRGERGSRGAEVGPSAGLLLCGRGADAAGDTARHAAPCSPPLFQPSPAHTCIHAAPSHPPSALLVPLPATASHSRTIFLAAASPPAGLPAGGGLCYQAAFHTTAGAPNCKRWRTPT